MNAQKQEQKLQKQQQRREAVLVKQQQKQVKKQKHIEKKAKLKIVRKELEARRLRTISNWFRLDNAALVYPSAGRHGWTFVYRFSAVLKEPVSPEYLQQAVNDIMPRFPTFNVRNRNIISFSISLDCAFEGQFTISSLIFLRSNYFF